MVAAAAVAVALLSAQVAVTGFLYLFLAALLLLQPCQARAAGMGTTERRPCATVLLAALAMLAIAHVVAQYIIGGKATTLSREQCQSIKRLSGLQCGSLQGMLISIGLPWLLVATVALHRCVI